ncbi:MAG: VanW family protein [Fimbriimonadaceae bacterium]
MRRSWVIGVVAATGALAAVVPVLTWPEDRVVASFATSLSGRTPNERHNAVLALHRLDGATIRPGETFSFNGRVGTFSRDQGYRKAPVSYDGQLIDDWGGGVCQSSTTLYNAALLAGMKIVERNRHRFAPGYVGPGRDAAVAYSSIDLRFANPYGFPVRIATLVRGACLVVELKASQPLPVQPRIVSEVRDLVRPRTFQVDDGDGQFRIRTSGASGFDVVVTRIEGNTREVISRDTYPVMNRVIGL